MTLELILKKYKAEDVSIALLAREVDNQKHIKNFKTLLEHNLDSYFHPASLLKLFITVMLTHTYPSLEEEIIKAINETIIHSDNDALAFLIDYLAPYPWDYNSTDRGVDSNLRGSSNGKALLEELCESRLKINQFFLDLGFSAGINLANKCFSFDYYGKEKDIYNKLGANRISNRDLIKLLMLIESESPLIMNAMQRKLIKETAEQNFPKSSSAIPSNIIDTDEYQVEAFAGKILRNKLNLKQIYSKAAWNSRVRHDAVIFARQDESSSERPSQTYILSILTKNLSYSEEILQDIVSEVISYI